MKKISVFLIGTLILLPFVVIILTKGFWISVLSLIGILVITLTGNDKDRRFWKEYFSCFKIFFPLPKDFNK